MVMESMDGGFKEDSRATLVWFRRDLRLQDNRAFAYAASLASPVLCLYIDDGSYKERSGGLFEVTVGASALVVA